MKIFVIKAPEVSENFRVVRYREDKVYEFDLDDNTITYIQTFKQSKNGYKAVHEIPGRKYTGLNIKNQVDSGIGIENFMWNGEFYAFSSLEKASGFRSILFQQAREHIKNYMNHLQEFMDHNVPDMSSQAQEFKEKYPEMFI